MSTQDHWMVTLQSIYYPVLAAVGIPSNILTFLIFWKRNCMLSRSSTFYLMAISVSDTLVLVLIVVLELTLKYYTEEPFWSHEPWCSLRDIFTYGAYNTSTWLVVGLTAERFVAINTVALKAKLCTRRCTLRVITAVVLLSFLCTIPFYWSNSSVFIAQEGRWVCVYKRAASDLYVQALVWSQTVLVYILPYLIIFSLNGLTMRLIARSNRVHVVAEPGAGPQKAVPLLRARKRKSVVLLVTVSMSFALLTVTRFVTQIALRTPRHYGEDRNDYSDVVNVAADVGTMLSLSNAAVNMYLYACTQPRFRREVAACVRLVLPPPKPRPSAAATVTCHV
ncbi:probable G-protein coupled receptor 139 [Megalops cyprinoides]|uniref:probable G-protein coupled receptor 139 n=1 Tax=Megalops cyprinoides TaxID=118141 RepID=UPI001863B038|nr:probable G-protein coupled receptor 139 [Megalops cyprinoides]